VLAWLSVGDKYANGFFQLTVLEEGDGPSMTDDTEEEESVDTEQTAAAGAATPARVSKAAATAQSPAGSTEDLSAKKKPAPSRTAGSGLRAPTAGKGE